MVHYEVINVGSSMCMLASAVRPNVDDLHAMDVEDAVEQRLRTEERFSFPIGLLLGGTVGGVNAVLAYRAEAGLGEQIDLLRAECIRQRTGRRTGLPHPTYLSRLSSHPVLLLLKCVPRSLRARSA